MEKINLAHGSGGKSSEELMKSIFGKHFSCDILNKMEDAAVLEVSGKIAYSTDSFVVEPVIFAGGDIGKLSVCGTVNDLLMMGAVPKYITAGYILEEGLEIDLLDRIAASMGETARQAGVKIVAGDTKVIESRSSLSEVRSGGSGGGLFINTSGIGIIPEGRAVSAAGCRPGDAVLLSGNLGDHHACILSARMGIKNNIASDCGILSELVENLFGAGVSVKAMRDVTRGGLGTVLNEIADSSGVAIEIAEQSIPVHSEVRSFCDILGLDPLYMGNEGKMLAVVAAEDADRALKAMRRSEYGKNAVMIGSVSKGAGVSMRTRIGGRRVVDVLYGEGLPRIC